MNKKAKKKTKKRVKKNGMVVVPIPVQNDGLIFLVGYSGEGQVVYSKSGDRTYNDAAFVEPMTWADAVAEIKNLRSRPAKSTIYKLVPVLTLDTRVWQGATLGAEVTA